MDRCTQKTQTLVPELQLPALEAQGDCGHAQQMLEGHTSTTTDEDRYQVAKCFYRIGGDAQSETLMRQLLTQPALWANVRFDVYYGLAKLSEHSNRLDEARQFYNSALAMHPDDLDSQCNLSMLDLKEGASPQSIEPVIRYIVNSNAASPLALECVVSYARNSSTLPDAQAVADLSCRQFLNFQKTEEHAWSCWAENSRKWYQDDPGRIQVELSTLDQAHEATLREALQQDPQNVHYLTALADFLIKTSQPLQAADVFEVIASLAADPDAQANALEKAASSYFLAGVPTLAESTWTRLKSIPGHEDQYIRGQALVAIAQLRFEDAMKILEKAHMVPSQLHRLASGARIAAFLSTKDYSRVGHESAKAFEQALAMCNDHLKLYPNDDTILHSYEYVNWRVQESAGKFDQIVTDRTDRLINIGRQWNNRLAAVYLTYGALAYLHRGKGYLSQSDKFVQAKADFDKADSILMEVLAKKDEMLASGDVLNIFNLMEAWLSLGWSKQNRGDYEASDAIFSAVVTAQDWPANKTQSEDLYDWPRQKILPKQLIEAYRGMGTSRYFKAQNSFRNKAYGVAEGLIEESIKFHEEGLALEKKSVGDVTVQFHHHLNMAIVDGDEDVLRDEQRAIVSEGYVTYIHYFDPLLHNENVFDLAVAQYWHAKILREERKMDQAVLEYNAAEEKFFEVLKVAPDDPESHRWLEYIYTIDKGDMDKAEYHYKEAKRLGTVQPIDALLKMVEGYDALIASDRDVTVEQVAKRNIMKIRRVQYAIALTDEDSDDSTHLERTLAYANELAHSSICDGNGPYRNQLLQMISDGMHLPSTLSASERKRRIQNHSRILKVLQPCLTAHKISTENVVSLTSAAR